MAKLYLDDGHEGVNSGFDPGAVGNGLKEAAIVTDINNRIETYLKNNYENIAIKRSRTGNKKFTLMQRTNEANRWGADYYFSTHVNSATGQNGSGYEDFIYSNLSNSSETAKKRDIVHAEVVKVLKKYGLRNRGKKKANFHVLRETKMSAILVETLFINNPSDAKLLKNKTFLQEIATAYAIGIAKVLKLKKKAVVAPKPAPKPVVDSNTFYRVVCGSFQDRKNADARVAQLKKAGFNGVFIDVFKK